MSMADAHEPWNPQIGQRVRVQLKRDCAYCNPWEDDLVGTVVATDYDGVGPEGYRLLAHRIWVKIDAPDSHGIGTANFAVGELEPVTS